MKFSHLAFGVKTFYNQTKKLKVAKIVTGAPSPIVIFLAQMLMYFWVSRWKNFVVLWDGVEINSLVIFDPNCNLGKVMNITKHN